MLKTTVLSILLLFCGITAFAEETVPPPPLKNMDFSEELKFWSSREIADKSFSVIKENDTNILQISGGKKEVNQLIQSINIPPADLLDKRLTLLVTVKPEKIESGSLHLMFREVNAQHKTIRYRTLKIDKWSKKEWQRVFVSVVVKKPTEHLQVYIQSNWLSPDDKILLKDMTLKISDSKKR